METESITRLCLNIQMSVHNVTSCRMVDIDKQEMTARPENKPGEFPRQPELLFSEKWTSAIMFSRKITICSIHTLHENFTNFKPCFCFFTVMGLCIYACVCVCMCVYVCVKCCPPNNFQTSYPINTKF